MAECSAAAKNGCRAACAGNLQCLFRGACLFSCLATPIVFLGSRSHTLSFSGKNRSLGSNQNVGFFCFLRYLILFRNTRLLSRPFISPCQQAAAAMEELECSRRTTAVSEATQRHHVSLYMVLGWKNCRKRYSSLTEIRRMLTEFCYFHVS